MKVFRVALVIYDRTLLRKAFLIAKNIVEREKKEEKKYFYYYYYVLHLTPPYRTHTHQKSKQNVDCTKVKRSFLIV